MTINNDYSYRLSFSHPHVYIQCLCEPCTCLQPINGCLHVHTIQLSFNFDVVA